MNSTEFHDEQRYVGLVSQQETDRRLAMHLCVWCARPIPRWSPADCFHGPDCQERWHFASNGRDWMMDTGHGRDGQPAPNNPAEATQPLAQHLTQSQATVPGHQRETYPRALIQLGGELAPPFDYGPRIYRSGSGVEAYEVAMAEERPGMLAPPPTRASSDRFEIGWPITDAPALQEIGPEPRGRTLMPVDEAARLWRRGFVFATRPDFENEARNSIPGTLRSVRLCDRCNAWDSPVLITAHFPSSIPGDDRQLENRFRTEVCCGACRRPYPGPSWVPMIQPPDNLFHAWTLVVTTPRGYYQTTVSEAAADRYAGGSDLGKVVWGDLYRKGIETVYPQPCHYPACVKGAEVWYQLGAALHWRGHRWAPTDGDPLRLGLCPEHNYHLRGQIATDRDVSMCMRMGIQVHGSGLTIA